MSRLREKTVQTKALQELESHYRKHKGVEYIYSRCEARTKEGKRADGLLCFKTEQSQYYTVSFEAKSHKTLSDLTSFVDEIKIGNYCVLSASAVTILAVALIAVFFSIVWYFLLMAAVLIFIPTILISIWVFSWLDLDGHKFNSVIEQLKRYPANEQWIVYSRDAYNLLANVPAGKNKSHQQLLDSLCYKNGFGLMLISKQRAEIVITPQEKKGSYLSAYCKEGETTNYLESGGTLVYKNPCAPISRC